MTTTEPTHQEALAELRQELDGIDTILLNALLMRHRCTRRVGLLKESRNIPVMQADRVRVVLERATVFARDNDMDPFTLQDIFTALINDACRQEEGHSPRTESAARDRIESLVGEITSHAYSSH